MKTLILILLFVATSAFGAQVELIWEPSPSDPNGYVLYYGQDATNFEFKRDVGKVLSTTVDGLGLGEWFFAVTAYNATLESEYSNVVSFTEVGLVIEENIHTPINRPSTVILNFK